jgi:hypothetical protein
MKPREEITVRRLALDQNSDDSRIASSRCGELVERDPSLPEPLRRAVVGQPVIAPGDVDVIGRRGNGNAKVYEKPPVASPPRLDTLCNLP